MGWWILKSDCRCFFFSFHFLLVDRQPLLVLSTPKAYMMHLLFLKAKRLRLWGLRMWASESAFTSTPWLVTLSMIEG